MKDIYEKPEIELLKFEIMNSMMDIGSYDDGWGDTDEDEI